MMTLKIGASALLLVIAMAFGIGGITNIEPCEVGLLVNMIGSDKGMQAKTMGTGMHWVNPIVYDTPIYDTRSYQVEVDDIRSQTQDGQPVLADISMEISLRADGVPNLHERIGPDYFKKVIYPAFRAVVRDSIATERSDVVYTGLGRTRIGLLIENQLNKKLNPNGINIDINFRNLNFVNKAFIETLEKKAIAAQKEEIERRFAVAALQSAIKVANIAEGAKQKVIKEAEADAEKARLQGLGERQQKEEVAKGILAVGQAEAEVVRLRNEAMNGPGGDKIVALAWAENLGPNVKVYGIPTGAPGTASMMDLNGILKGAFGGMAPLPSVK